MRARNLKPSLFKNEVLGVADPLLTILFEGLWCEADREGRLEDRPLRIKAEIFPYREGININKMLDWLESNNFIHRYKVNGVGVIQVAKFADHQRPHTNEVASTLPPIHESDVIEVQTTSNQGEQLEQPSSKALCSDSLLLTPDSPFLTADCAIPSATPPGPKRQDVDRVFNHWKQVWQHEGATLDPKRRARIEARLKNFTPEQLCDAISGFKNSDWHTGIDPKGGGKIYDKIETLLREDSQVEEGLRLLAHPPRPPPKVVELSPVERVLRANGVGASNERVVSEQNGRGDESLGDIFGNVRESPNTGIRRIGS